MTTIEKGAYGKTKDGKIVDRYTLKNQNGMTVEIITFGGIITKIIAPDKDGKLDDVCLGFDNMEGYEAKHPYFGALVGRVANRIAGGKFTLDGKTYELAVNNGPNHLHGGLKGFDKAVWTTNVEGTKLHLTHTSPDGDEGYPGEMTVHVTYELTSENELILDYSATSTKATPINLTNHAYFNLAGQGTANVYDHYVTINAETFTPKDENSIPTGEIASVEGTVFDLRKPVRIGDRINNVPGDKGYDHNFCVGEKRERKHIAKVEHRASGRVMDVYTEQPGVQLYTGNYLAGISGKGGAIYGQHSALCLETQNYPDAVNKPNFPNAILKPGETYRHTTSYKFSTQA
ncbi:aldose 1-epimerase [Lingula anatina]|uniref:Aldose 1-epimerase n=1 Tax=Lingula anatina TaxID=7574 RepID=A0A1S3H0U3_LINAN|nr:aldose 1-epimerase [Lingula anatina]|eukprot:XP_013379096.1 aldose 1-epimerase [Lingula anatina]